MKKKDKDALIAFYRKSHNYIKRNIIFYLKKRKRNYGMLDQNKDLKSTLAGKRCFIIGNGPSLKTQDLTILKNEIVFTVNQAVRHTFFEDIKTNYHFWTDPNLFVIDDSSEIDKSIVDMMKKVKTVNNNPVCFYPLNQKSFVELYGLDKVLNIKYISSELGWLYENFDEPIELDRQIPVFGTVVQYAIVAAIYMGVSEIYLLGCDNTGIVNSVNSILEENDGSNYGYKVSEMEKIRMQRTAKRNGLELDSLAYYNDIKSYRLLYEYCRKRNIKLMNCSARTVIDSIPKIDLELVVHR